jgi:hypothetical protein
VGSASTAAIHCSTDGDEPLLAVGPCVRFTQIVTGNSRSQS